MDFKKGSYLSEMKNIFSFVLFLSLFFLLNCQSDSKNPEAMTKPSEKTEKQPVNIKSNPADLENKLKKIEAEASKEERQFVSRLYAVCEAGSDHRWPRMISESLKQMSEAEIKAHFKIWQKDIVRIIKEQSGGRMEDLSINYVPSANNALSGQIQISNPQGNSISFKVVKENGRFKIDEK